MNTFLMSLLAYSMMAFFVTILLGCIYAEYQNVQDQKKEKERLKNNPVEPTKEKSPYYEEWSRAQMLKDDPNFYKCEI